MDIPSSRDPSSDRGSRLESWKEIAAYLNRDVRTVQRWEKQEGLPVHRHLHDERGTAYAFRHELDAWLSVRTRGPGDAAAQAESSAGGTPANPVAGFGAARLARWIAVGVVAAAAVIGTFVGSVKWWARRETPPVSTLSITFSASERFREWGPEVALSPDGRTLVYGSGAALNVRRIDQLETRKLLPDAMSPFFSPGGKWLGARRTDGRLVKTSIDGGPPVALGSSVSFIGAADWGPDDYIVYADVSPEGGHGLYRTPADAGPARLIATLNDAEDAYWLTPQSLEDGRTILSTLVKLRETGAHFQIVAVSVATGERRVLVDNARHAMYIGDGVLVYQRDESLFAALLDLDRMEVVGRHVPAWQDVHERMRLRSWTHAGGTLVYWPAARASRRLVWVDRTGREEVLPLPPAQYQSPRVSPDGRSIVYGISKSAEFGDIWRHDLSTGTTVQLTLDGRSATPLWAPDGKRIVYSSLGSTRRTLHQLQLATAAVPEPIAISATNLQRASLVPVSWADDGRTLIASATTAQARSSLWAIAIDGSREPAPILPRSTGGGQVSPDRRWLAVGDGDVFVMPLPERRPRWQVSSGGGHLPSWSRSGRELFYLNSAGLLMAATVPPGVNFRINATWQLFQKSYFEAEPGGPNYDISADDSRFLMVMPATTDGPDRLNVVLGWKEEVLRRLRAR